ncbi:MAG: CAAX amino terminal protease self- immunity [bacterium ADurb.Bin429]|nr:MAG: CAAX amino terminal protease self- immunity [bacterium ADurb.Bin429]
MEEPLFRGTIFGGLQRTWQPFWAFLLSAFLYVTAHPGEPWLAFLFIASLGYAAALRLGHSLLAPMLAHSLTAAALLLGRLYPSFVLALPAVAFALVAGAAIVMITAGASQPSAREP